MQPMYVWEWSLSLARSVASRSEPKKKEFEYNCDADEDIPKYSLSNTWSQINVIIGFDIIISFKEFKSCLEISQPTRRKQESVIDKNTKRLRNRETQINNQNQEFTFYMEVVHILPRHQEAQNLCTLLSPSQAQPSSLHPLTVQWRI